MRRIAFPALTLLIAFVWTFHVVSVEAISESPSVENQVYAGQTLSTGEGTEHGQISLYTATDADDFASKLADMACDYENMQARLFDAQAETEDEYASARLLIRASEAPLSLAQYSLTSMLTDGNGFYVVECASPEKAREYKEFLDTQSYVQYVEPDRIIALGPVDAQASGSPLLPDNPPLSWGVSGTGMDVFAALLKEQSLSSAITAAVVDTGADLSHSFLSGRMLDGHNYIENNESMRDGNGHGTHVSGTIAESTAGLHVSIMPVRVMCDEGWGYSSVISLGVRYAADNGANVINLSLGGGHNSYMDEAIEYAISKNVTVVVAAGNSNDDTEKYCPAHLQNCITVAAVDSGWNKAGFSNYGDAVDIAAPGVGIVSCIPGEQYASWNGTSMAAPHVTAAAALLLYENNKLKPGEVENELREAAIDRGPAGWDKDYGAGTLSMQKWIPGGTLLREGKFGENDNLTWSQYSDNSLRISGEGAIPDYGWEEDKHAPWYDFRAGVQKVVIDSGITKIGNYAFWDSGNLTEVSIANTITGINHAAFHKCVSLSQVTLPDSVETLESSAFDGCLNLSAITFGVGIKTIEANAFKNCTSLTSFAIPDSVTNIQGAAFDGCTSLTAFTIGDNSHFSVSDGVLFSKDSKTLIAYPGGKNGSYTVPEGTVSIGVNAFSNCPELKEVTLPNSVTEIGWYSFSGSGLTNITLSNNLKSIGGYYVFSDCKNLTTIKIPASVTSIGGSPFNGCVNLREIQVDTGNTNYCDVDGVLFTKDMNTLITYPIGKTDTEYMVPDGVFAISSNSFMRCNLTSVVFPEGFKEIGGQSFGSSGKLENITLPSTLTNIYSFTFLYCNALKDVYYYGSQDQWKNVNVDPDYNGPLLEATMHYSQITVGNAESRPGGSVDVPITIENNPGLTAMRLRVSYNSNVLTLEGVTDGGILGTNTHNTDYSLNPYTLFWNNHTSETNFKATGTIVTLKFKVASDAADGTYPVSVSYDTSRDILNKDMKSVEFDIANGGISVAHILYGDVDDNKKIETRDSAILDRDLADWRDYKNINSENADVNTDNSVSVLDSIILARHIANWKGFETLPYLVQFNASLMSDSEPGTIEVGSAKGAPGEIIPVSISLQNNPGLTMMRLFVAYDSEALELKEVKDAGILGAQVHSDNYERNPYTLFWKNGESKENFTANGTAVTLLFRIRDDVPNGSYPITMSYDAEMGDILDCNLNPVSFQITGGNITVTSTSAPSVAFVDVSVNPDNPDDNRITATISRYEPGTTVWCGMYSESGQFMGVICQDIVDGQTEYVFSPHMTFSSLKIFVLDSELRPLCAPMVGG